MTIKRVPSLRPWPVVGTGRVTAYEHTHQRQEDKNFYSSTPWLKVRRVKLCRNPLCEECGRNGLVVVARHVHHILERKARPDLALDLDNLMSLCVPCHNKMRKR